MIKRQEILFTPDSLTTTAYQQKNWNYLRDQYIVNQSNYLDKVVDEVPMNTLFGSDKGDGDNKIKMKFLK